MFGNFLCTTPRLWFTLAAGPNAVPRGAAAVGLTALRGLGMTLIQTVWTNDRILQVSDRRLTANGALIDDYYTKLVIWNERFTVGF